MLGVKVIVAAWLVVGTRTTSPKPDYISVGRLNTGSETLQVGIA